MRVDIDLNKAIDNYCSKCGKKKRKYIGSIAGAPAVLYENTCKCDAPILSSHKMSDREMFEHLQTPFWKHMGLRPKPKEQAFESYLKWRGMTYGDYRKEQDAKRGRYQSSLGDFEKHVERYGTKNAPDNAFDKSR